MKIINKPYLTLLLCTLVISFFGCKKDFLEKKPSSKIVVPVTLSDMVQLLDNNTVFQNNTPSLGILSADEYYYPSLEAYNATDSKTEKNSFTWNKEIYDGEVNIVDWNVPYQSVFYANVVLEQWEKLNEGDKISDQGKFIKAWALFSRSYAFFNLVQIFAPAYNSTTAATDLGIPIKLSANINEIQQRSTLKDTYDRIITDLEASIDLYPNSFPSKNLNRPSKESAFALLGRIYLSMGLFTSALANADKCLALKNQLMDYNTLDNTSAGAFQDFNVELIRTNSTVSNYPSVAVGYSSSTINPELISLYDGNDLRKELFFRRVGSEYLMNFMYMGRRSYWPFTGLAVDELYLIRAECLARKGEYNSAMDVLNSLLIKRYKFDPLTNKSLYISQTASSPQEALQKVLLERRKELVWRGLRWSDLKRLNAEGANITLERNLVGKKYILPANDPRYVLPIPSDELALSHIQQNQR